MQVEANPSDLEDLAVPSRSQLIDDATRIRRFDIAAPVSNAFREAAGHISDGAALRLPV